MNTSEQSGRARLAQRLGVVGISVLLLYCGIETALVFRHLGSGYKTLAVLTDLILFVPAGLVCLCALLRSQQKHRWALSLIVLYAGLGIVDLLLVPRVYGWRTAARAAMAANHGVAYDKRSFLEVFEDLRADGRDPVFTAGLFKGVVSLNDGTEIRPLSGLAGRTTIVANETGEYYIYEADEHGFDNPSGLYRHENIDVALIGDSFTQGCSVQSDENMGAVLRRRIPRTLNLGYCAHGPLANLATVREFVKPLQPKIVFWFHYEGNDLVNLSDELATPLSSYLIPDYSIGMLDRQHEIDLASVDALERIAPAGMPDSLAVSLRLYNAVRLQGLRQLLREFTAVGRGLKESKEAERLTPLLASIVASAATAVQQYGGKLVFVYLPAHHRLKSGPPSAGSDPRTKLLPHIEQHGIPVIDCAVNFSQHPDPLSLFPFRQVGHYNADGYAFVAEIVGQFIQEQSLLDQSDRSPSTEHTQQ